MISLQITNAIGVQLSVALNSEDDLHDAMRHWGRKRWRTIALPYGGLHFPLAMAETFDWAIIGAQPDEFKNDESGAMEPGVWFENRFYKRRDLPANEKKKMEAAVKYSRGANDTDRANPNILVEGDDKFGYVTLVIFRGTGRVQRDYERPRTQAPQTRQPDPQPKPVVQPPVDEAKPQTLPTAAESGLKGEALADAIARGLVAPPADPNDTVDDSVIRAIEAAAAQAGLDDKQLVDLSIRTIKTPAWRQTTVGNARALFAAISHYKMQGAA